MSSYERNATTKTRYVGSVGAHALSDVEAATNTEVDARLRAKGMEPGQGAAVIEKLRKK